MWGWIGLGLLGVVAAVATLQHMRQRGSYRPLASRQPARSVGTEKPLGFEAIDMAAVNSATRRNESLERSLTSWTRGPGLLSGAADTDIHPLADDETYARRFHQSFMQDKDKRDERCSNPD